MRNLIRIGIAFIAIHSVSWADNFYAGRTVTVIVGYGPGGGYDLNARLLARHLGKHIPGNPNVVVQNMAGAGSVRAANYVFKSAVQDGTVIAAVNQTLPLYALIGGEGIQFDPTKLQWLGSIEASNSVLVTFKSSTISNLAQAKERDVPLGGSGVGSDSNLHATALNNLLGTRFKVINGYQGAGDIHLAMERGEVAGRAGITWSSIVASNKRWLTENRINVLVQLGLSRDPDLPDAPLLTELVSNPDDKQLARLLTVPVAVGFAYWVGPNVDKERLGVLRTAFERVLSDKEFLADAAQSSMRLAPKSGAEIETLLAETTKVSKSVLDRFASMVRDGN